MTDEYVGRFVKELVNEEIKPTIELPEKELNAFADAVIERFMNPFIRHELISISLNSTTKFRTRLLPTYNDYRAKFGKSPKHILFAFASLVVFFRGKRGDEDIPVKDDTAYLEFWSGLWKLTDPGEIAKKALSAVDLWQQDLDEDDNAAVVAGYIKNILENGEMAALKDFLGE